MALTHRGTEIASNDPSIGVTSTELSKCSLASFFGSSDVGVPKQLRKRGPESLGFSLEQIGDQSLRRTALILGVLDMELREDALKTLKKNLALDPKISQTYFAAVESAKILRKVRQSAKLQARSSQGRQTPSEKNRTAKSAQQKKVKLG